MPSPTPARRVAALADELIDTLERAERLAHIAHTFGGDVEREWLDVIVTVGSLSLALEHYDGRARPAWKAPRRG